jgi:hypothetical protein
VGQLSTCRFQYLTAWLLLCSDILVVKGERKRNKHREDVTVGMYLRIGRTGHVSGNGVSLF